jgi:hypothetical protein
MRSKEKETWNVQGCHHSKLQHLPERLLSNWKVCIIHSTYICLFFSYITLNLIRQCLHFQAISPASQKKLCKAMESGDLGDEDYYSE